MPRSLLLAAALLTGACAAALYEPVGFDAVDQGYVVGGGSWNTGGGITAVADVQERNGNTVVCGAWATDVQSVLSVPYNRDVMSAGSVYLGDARLVQDLGFMRETEHPAQLAAAEARCVDTGVAWRPEFAGMQPSFAFPRLSFHDDDELGSGDIVFRQTPRENPLD